MSTASRKARQKDSPSEPVIVVVETPKGCRIKYKFDEQTGHIKLSKVMPEGMVFPYDFGFFPGTKGEDGDPLDVLILCDEPTFPGCQIDCRLIGILKASQKDKDRIKRNDRLIAVAQASILYAGLAEISDMEPQVLKQIEDFFINYKKVRGVDYKILSREGSKAAREALNAASEKKAA